MRSYFLASATFLCAVAAWSVGSASAATLCSAKEKVVFSCSTGKKLVSVCRTEGAPTNVQYRFGTPGAIDIALPQNTASHQGVAAAESKLAGGYILTFIRFTNDATRYFVYSGGGKQWNPEGVAVVQNGKAAIKLPCKGRSIDNLHLIGAIDGLPKAEDDEFINDVLDVL